MKLMSRYSNRLERWTYIKLFSHQRNVLPDLYLILKLEDEVLWREFMTKGDQIKLPHHCTDRVSYVQFILIVQALRPDKLHSFLTHFALQTLELQVLSPPMFSFNSLLAESSCSDPILFIISPGTDPSSELRDLASLVVSTDNYHEIVLGQGQTETALKCLRDASKNGHWLVLKNLHLMISWLPTLEKELKGLTPHQNFRLWLTSEPHPNFPHFLANSSLKIAYEAPPGVKRNLLQTFSSWLNVRPKNSEHATAMFILAWFHAIVQERRTYIPQGWVTNYEFKDADLHTAVNFLHKRIQEDGHKGLKWEHLRGLCLDSIYGARIDNRYDLRILSSYLNTYFQSSDVKNNPAFKKLPNFYIPSSSNISDYFSAIKKLPDVDEPQLFGLPVTIDRSWQKIKSSEVINQLKGLSRKTEHTGIVNQDEWKTQLSPILNLWKKLNQGLGFLQMKPADPPKEKLPLIEEFFFNELEHGIMLIHEVHKSLASLSRVIRGVSQPSPSTQALAETLASLKVPYDWIKLWVGPKNPMRYIRSAIHRASAILRLNALKSESILNQPIDLADIYHPSSFFTVMRQYSARMYNTAFDELVLKHNWSKRETNESEVSVRVTGLLLEGVSFNGRHLEENTIDSPTVSTVPDVTIGWIPKNSIDRSDSQVAFPLYMFSDRETSIIDIKVPSRPNELDKWIQTGAAFHLRN